MNVYDFDNTIYKGDSTADFYFFCLKKHKKILKHFPRLALYFSRYYILQMGTKTEFKENMYKFLTSINLKEDLPEFWGLHKKNIKPWYLKQQKENDLIISASPYFLLEPICKALNIKNLIASDVDPHTGMYTGLNCYGKEKKIRFYENFKGVKINEFYSDSYSDEPLAKIAKRAYFVKDNDVCKWNFNR